MSEPSEGSEAHEEKATESSERAASDSPGEPAEANAEAPSEAAGLLQSHPAVQWSPSYWPARVSTCPS